MELAQTLAPDWSFQTLAHHPCQLVHQPTFISTESFADFTAFQVQTSLTLIP